MQKGFVRRLMVILALSASLVTGACAADEGEELGSLSSPGWTGPGNGLVVECLTDVYANPLLLTPRVNRWLSEKSLRSAFTGDNPDAQSAREALGNGPFAYGWCAPQFMEYVVSCALPAGHSIQATSAAGHEYTWHGALGLAPGWEMYSPFSSELETVSACVLARVNAQGRTVHLSYRGDALGLDGWTTTPIANANQRTAVEYEPGKPIASFAPCTGWQSGFVDCGWSPAHVGHCTPGEPVDVGAGAPPPGRCQEKLLGRSMGDTVLRVCRGAVGCDGTHALKQNDDSPCGGRAPSDSFLCPAEGQYALMTAPFSRWSTGSIAYPQAGPGLVAYPAGAVAPLPVYAGTEDPVESLDACSATVFGPRDCGWSLDRAGVCTPGESVTIRAADAAGSCLLLRVCGDGAYACDDDLGSWASSDALCGSSGSELEFECPPSGAYSIMTAPWVSTYPHTPIVSKLSGSGVYPASDDVMARFTEGAFYGTIFGPDAVADLLPEQPGVVLPKMHACFGPDWVDGNRYLKDGRICAGSGRCAINVAGACREHSTATVQQRCGSQRTDDGAVDDCFGGGTVWQYPLTTRLVGPCDIFGGESGSLLEPACLTF